MPGPRATAASPPRSRPSRSTRSSTPTRRSSWPKRSGWLAAPSRHLINVFPAFGRTHVRPIHMGWSKDGAGRAQGLPPRQSARGADPGRAQSHRREGAGGLHLRRCRARGGGQFRRALPPFPRPRRPDGRRRQARLRAVRRGAAKGLERRQAQPLRGVRGCGAGLSGLRPQRAGALLGDVRGRHPAGFRRPTCSRRPTRPSTCCAARRKR